MGSALSSLTLETETKSHEQTDKKPIQDQSSQVSNQPQKVVFEEGKEKQSTIGSSSSKTLETETKPSEEIGQNSRKDQALQVTDEPKEKSKLVVEEIGQKALKDEPKEELSNAKKEQVVVEKGKEGEEKEEDEEEEECGFCLFMKGGGCKETFVAWENCIEEVEKEKGDIVEKCFEVTSALKKCMEEHADYYGPILQAEKAAEQKVISEFEKMKEEEEKANKSVDKEAIVEVEKDGVAASGEKDDLLVKEAVVEA